MSQGFSNALTDQNFGRKLLLTSPAIIAKLIKSKSRFIHSMCKNKLPY